MGLKYVTIVDREEIYLATGFNCAPVIITSWNMSCKRDILRMEGRAIGILGVVDAGEGKGVPWMVGTKDLDLITKTFINDSRGYLKKSMEGFSSLENMVFINSKKSIKWLKWLGFKFDEPKPYGPFGAMFMKFSLESSNV